jgi:hypothetical protein
MMNSRDSVITDVIRLIYETAQNIFLFTLFVITAIIGGFFVGKRNGHESGLSNWR